VAIIAAAAILKCTCIRVSLVVTKEYAHAAANAR
jgi:hypothetical protein